MRKSTGAIALGGVLAALAVVIMTMGGLIPVATYVCPMLCSIILLFVKIFGGVRVGWSWYASVCVLSSLLSPDKEAAAVFVALGYYPLIQSKLDSTKFPWLWKGLLFNAVTVCLYGVLLYLLGMDQITQEFQELGMIGLVITLSLGNVCFFMLDFVLKMLPRKFGRKVNEQ